jgi:hypothetical protein
VRKKLAILAMVTLVALVTITPALAFGSGVSDGSEQQVFSVRGTITAIGVDTITIQVSEGSRLAWPFINKTLTVQMAQATFYYEWTPDGLESIDFGDVEVDDTTNIHGTVAENGDFTAGRVILSP